MCHIATDAFTALLSRTLQARGVVDRMLSKELWQQTEADEGQKTGTVALVRRRGGQPGTRARMPSYCIAYSVLHSASFQLSFAYTRQHCGRQTLCQGCLCSPGGGACVRPPKRHIASAFLTMQGIANLVGVTWLGSLLRDASIKAALASSSLGFVAGAMPFLQVRQRVLGCRALV